MSCFSVAMVVAGIWGVINRYYHGLFTYFFGVRAVIMSIGVLVIALISLANYIKPFNKRLKSCRWFTVVVAIIIWEVVLREFFVFWDA